MTFAAFVEEWESTHLVRVWASTAKRYRELLKHQLLPVFGDRLQSSITAAAAEAFVAEATRSGQLAPWRRVRGPVVPLEACVRVGGRWYTSAWGRVDLAFDDPDAESTAVKLPPATTEAAVSAIALRAIAPIGETVQMALVRAFFLGEGYRPPPSFAGPAVCLLDAAGPEQVVWARH